MFEFGGFANILNFLFVFVTALSILWRTNQNGQPSNVLWIGYPPSVCVEEQMLHNAMMFGEVEIIRSFPSHDYSRVEFRSVDGAWRGKEGLQCRLLNDPRILFMYSTSNVGCPKYSLMNHHMHSMISA